MNSSGNNVDELKKEIRILKKKISDLIDLCKSAGVHESTIEIRLKKYNNNSSQQFANQQASFAQKALLKLQQARFEQQAKIQEEARKRTEKSESNLKRKEEMQLRLRLRGEEERKRNLNQLLSIWEQGLIDNKEHNNESRNIINRKYSNE